MTVTAFTAGRFVPLYRNLVRREVRQRYKGSFLGLAWTLVTPAIMVGAYSLVFKFLLRIQIPHYALFLFVGLTVWTFFFGGAQMARIEPGLQREPGHQGELPPADRPPGLDDRQRLHGGRDVRDRAAPVRDPDRGLLGPAVMLPVLIVLLAAFTVGFGLLLSAVNVYFRDVEHILGAVGLPWIFVSPIFYSFSTVPGLDGREWVADVLHWANPIAPFIIAIQDSLFWGQWPFWGDVLYSVVAAAVMLLVGMRVFRRLEREMAVEL